MEFIKIVKKVYHTLGIILKVLAMLIPIGMVPYWAYNRTGLYEWLVTCQVRWFDGFYPFMTFLVSFGLMLIVGMLGVLILSFIFPPEKEETKEVQL